MATAFEDLVPAAAKASSFDDLVPASSFDDLVPAAPKPPQMISDVPPGLPTPFAQPGQGLVPFSETAIGRKLGEPVIPFRDLLLQSSFFAPFLRETGVAQGAAEGIGRTLEAFSTPKNLGVVAGAGLAPEVVVPYLAAHSLINAPAVLEAGGEGFRQIFQGKTPDERGAGAEAFVSSLVNAAITGQLLRSGSDIAVEMARDPSALANPSLRLAYLLNRLGPDSPLVRSLMLSKKEIAPEDVALFAERLSPRPGLTPQEEAVAQTIVDALRTGRVRVKTEVPRAAFRGVDLRRAGVEPATTLMVEPANEFSDLVPGQKQLGTGREGGLEATTAEAAAVPPAAPAGPAALVPPAKPVTAKQAAALLEEKLQAWAPALAGFDFEKYPSFSKRAEIIRGLIARNAPNAEDEAKKLNAALEEIGKREQTAAAGGIEGAGRYEVATEGNLVYLRDRHTGEVVTGGVSPKADIKGIERLRNRALALNASDSFDQFAISEFLSDDEQAQFGQPVPMKEIETGRQFLNRSGAAIQGRDNSLVNAARQRALDALGVDAEDTDRGLIERDTLQAHELRGRLLPVLQETIGRRRAEQVVEQKKARLTQLYRERGLEAAEWGEATEEIFRLKQELTPNTVRRIEREIALPKPTESENAIERIEAKLDQVQRTISQTPREPTGVGASPSPTILTSPTSPAAPALPSKPAFPEPTIRALQWVRSGRGGTRAVRDDAGQVIDLARTQQSYPAALQELIDAGRIRVPLEEAGETHAGWLVQAWPSAGRERAPTEFVSRADLDRDIGTGEASKPLPAEQTKARTAPVPGPVPETKTAAPEWATAGQPVGAAIPTPTPPGPTLPSEGELPTVAEPATPEHELHLGDEVEATLPDGGTVAGTVYGVDSDGNAILKTDAGDVVLPEKLTQPTEVERAHPIESTMAAVRRETPGAARPVAEGAPGELRKPAGTGPAEEARLPEEVERGRPPLERAAAGQAEAKAVGLQLPAKIADATLEQRQAEAERALTMTQEQYDLHPWVIEPKAYLRDHPEPLKLPDDQVAQLGSNWYNEHRPTKRGTKKLRVFLGLPASGKSMAIGDVAETGEFLVDCDPVKETLDGFAQGMGAGFVHRASSVIIRAALEQAKANGDDIALPVVGCNLEKTRKLLRQFKADGYDVEVIYVPTDPPTSKGRSLARYFRGKQGFIPWEYIDSLGLRPHETFVTLRQENEFTLYREHRAGGQPAEAGTPVDRGTEAGPGAVGLGAGRALRPVSGVGGGAGKRPAGPRPERAAGERGAGAGAAPTGAGERQGREVSESDRIASEPAAHAPANVGNFIITDLELLSRGGAKTKFQNNLAALRTLRAIEAEGRSRATLEEQQALAKWLGWGQFPQVFDEKNAEWNAEREALRKLLVTPEEWEAAKRSTINAHYTDPKIAAAMWRIVERLGFGRGRVLEAGMGSGVFVGTAPAPLRDRTAFTGVELDPVTGAIARLLYPGANVQVKGFQDFQAPDGFFDLNIGNYPFGDITILSDRTYAKFSPSLHDYFLLKAVDKIHPGGLIVVVTSAFTMDKRSNRIRQEIDRKAELVAAFRLPGGAFQKVAGTEVVTDLLVFRKWLPDERPRNEPWLDLASMDTPDGMVAVNEYFAAHPENILGTLNKQSRLYHRGQMNVVLTDDFKKRFEEAVERLPRDIYRAETAAPAFVPEVRLASEMAGGEQTKPGGYLVKDGKLYMRDPQTGALVERAASVSKLLTIRDALKVRDALRSLVELEVADATEDDVALARGKLNQAYDYFAGKHGRFYEKRNATLLRPDPDAPNLFALERRDPRTGLTKKADIFTKRTVRGGARPERASSLGDALSVSLNEMGGVNLKRIAGLLGQTETEVAESLVSKKLAFLDPSGGWVPADFYLSGNVRKKLLEAREAAAADPKYQPNVTALEAVQPKDVDYAVIGVRLGAGWVPAGDVAAFAAHLLSGDPEDFVVRYLENLGKWAVEYSNDGERKLAGKPAARQVWGTPRADFIELLQDTLDGKTTRIYDRHGKDSVLNGPASADAAAKQEQIKAAFRGWIWQDDARRERLHRLYNDEHNNRRLYRPNGSHLSLPGSNPEIHMYPHQKDFVWRVLTMGRAAAAHEVGTGKTFAMAAAAMELKRMGLAHKPALATTKDALPGGLADIRRLYPHANILTTDGKFERAERRQTVSQIATGDWDLIVLTHDNLDMLPMSPEVQEEFLRSELRELETVLEAAAEEHGRSSRIVKQLEKAKARVEERLKKALAGTREKDTNTYFEHTGIDFLFLDEAHLYKSLAVHTSGERVKGIPSTLSQRAANMFMRTQWLLKMNNGRGVVFATGTPVANTMAELYTMQRYLQLPELEAQGLQAFDSWKNMFGEIVSDVEPKVTGEYDIVSRFAKFTNLPELLELSREMMDVVFADDAGVPVKRPKKTEHLVTTELSDLQRAFMNELQERAEAIRLKKVDPDQDNFLKISTDGRKMAIDARLVRADAADDPASKINRAVENVLRIHRENPGKTQLIFLDLYQGAANPGFNLYGEIADKLVKGGIPREKIIDFSDLSDKQREAAAKRLFDGDALVAIGGTKKLGTGVNAQQYLLAVHHLDAPWRPAEVEQRDGRIWRQLNTNPEVHIYRYITKGSFDAFLWNLLDRKNRFIKQVMKGDITQREAVDEKTDELSYDEIKAIASGNPDMMEFVRLQNVLRRLEAAERRHLETGIRGRDTIRKTEQQIAGERQKATAIEADVAQAEATKNAPFTIKVFGRTFTDRKEAGLRLVQVAENPPAPETVVGEYRGFKLLGPPTGYAGLLLAGQERYYVTAENPLASVDGVLRNLAGRLTKQREQVAALESGLEKVRQQQGQPFTEAEQLTKTRTDLAAIEARLRGKEEPPEPGVVKEDTIRQYLGSVGVTDPAAADGISRALQLVAEKTVGGADAPYPEVVRERADEAVARQRAALAEGRAAVEEAQRRLEAAGIKGDVAALAATLDRKGRASSLLPELISGDIPVWDVRGTVINSPADMYAALYPIRSPYFESFKVAVLSDDNVVVHSQIVTVGTINASLIEPTQLLGVLARVRAATGKKYNRIILAHNHPSGDPMPSAEDIAVTKRVTKAAEALGFEVLDHVITDGENYASLKELGLHASVSAGRAARAPKALERKPAPALPPEGKAPWELTQRGPKLIPLTEPSAVVDIVKGLRNSDLNAGHVLYLTTKHALTGVERVADLGKLSLRELWQRINAGLMREGAPAFILDLTPLESGMAASWAYQTLKQFQVVGAQLLDGISITEGGRSYVSLREKGVMETPAGYGEVEGAGTTRGAWIKKDGTVVPVTAGHETAAKREGLKSNLDALSRGWLRVVETPDEVLADAFRSELSPSQHRALQEYGASRGKPISLAQGGRRQDYYTPPVVREGVGIYSHPGNRYWLDQHGRPHEATGETHEDAARRILGYKPADAMDTGASDLLADKGWLRVVSAPAYQEIYADLGIPNAAQRKYLIEQGEERGFSVSVDRGTHAEKIFEPGIGVLREKPEPGQEYRPSDIEGVTQAMNAAVDGPVLLPKDPVIKRAVDKVKSFEEAAMAALMWAKNDTGDRWIGVKRLIGQPHEFLKGNVPGTDIWHLKKLYDATTQLAKDRVLATWGIRFLKPEIVDVLRKVPYLDDAKIAAIARKVLAVPGLAEKLGIAQSRQKILFRTAEAVPGFKPDGSPQFGALADPRDYGKGWRYSPEEAEALWEQLRPQERELVKTWDKRRQELAVQEGIEVGLEAYMRRYHENQGSIQRLVDQLREAHPLKGREAGFRKERKGAPGFTEDFQRAIVMREIESELERRHNEFVQQLELMIARPVEPRPGQSVNFGVNEDGTPRRFKLEKIDEDGNLVLREQGAQAIRVPANQAALVRLAYGERLQAGQLREGEVTTRREHGPFAGEMVAVDRTTFEWFKEFLTRENAAARGAFANFLWGKAGPGGFLRNMLVYWKLNQLSLAMGTAATNAAGNSIFHAAMTANDFFRLGYRATTKLKAPGEVTAALSQVLRDLAAPFEALTPAGVRRSPPPLYGAKAPGSLVYDAGLMAGRGGLLGLWDELVGGRPGTVQRGLVQRGVDVLGGAVAGAGAGGLVGGPVGAAVGVPFGAVFGMARLLEAGMVPFQLVENYIRRVTYLSRMQDRDPRLVEKILDGTADPEVMRQLDRVFDSIRVWQVDYGASPLFMKKLGEGTVPFMRWIYGYARQISGQLPFGKNKDAESRIAGILTLLAVAYLLQAAIHWIMARGQKPTVGKGQVEENAPGQFQPQGRQFVGKTGAGEEVFFRTAKYPYLNLVPLLNGAIDDARHGRLKDLPAAAQTLGQEGISAGPTLQSLTWVFGYKQPYDLYKSPSEIAADDLSGFVPFHRLNEYRNRLAQTKADEGQMYLTKPRGFWGNLELGLPPELRNVQRSVPEDRVLNKQTSEFVRLKPDAEALKEWAGINLRFVDPADYQLWQEEQREKGLKLDTDQSARLRKFVVDGLMDRGENAGRSRAFIEAMYDRAEKEAGRLGRVQLATIEKRIITGSVPRDQVDRLALAYAGDNPELQKEIVMLLVRQKPEGVTDEAWAEQNRADAKVLARQRLIQALRQRIQRERPQRTIEILREELAGERR